MTIWKSKISLPLIIILLINSFSFELNSRAKRYVQENSIDQIYIQPHQTVQDETPDYNLSRKKIRKLQRRNTAESANINKTGQNKQLKQKNNPIKSPKAIIFDVGNTLFKVSTFGMAREIGLSDFMLYNYWDKQDPHEIQTKVFKILEQIKAYPKNSIHCYSGKLQIPQIMCDWFAGTISSEQIYNKVKPYIEKLNKENFFRNKREKRLIENTIHAMFDPYVLAKNMKPIAKAEKLVRALKDKGNNLFILSNWDPESFNQLQALGHAKRIFSYFKPENIIISGKIGLIKPDLKIFKYLLNKFKLKAKDCIFIDDQLENIEAAKKLGINAIWLEDFNYNKVRNELIKLNAL